MLCSNLRGPAHRVIGCQLARPPVSAAAAWALRPCGPSASSRGPSTSLGQRGGAGRGGHAQTKSTAMSPSHRSGSDFHFDQIKQRSTPRAVTSRGAAAPIASASRRHLAAATARHQTLMGFTTRARQRETGPRYRSRWLGFGKRAEGLRCLATSGPRAATLGAPHGRASAASAMEIRRGDCNARCAGVPTGPRGYPTIYRASKSPSATNVPDKSFGTARFFYCKGLIQGPARRQPQRGGNNPCTRLGLGVG